MLEFDRVASSTIMSSQKNRLSSVRSAQPVFYGTLVKKFARQIIETQELLDKAKLKKRSSNEVRSRRKLLMRSHTSNAINQGILLGGGEHENEHQAFADADADGDGAITYVFAFRISHF